ncbi:MAG TPA: NAD-dependent epimerase/dehydratase family protein [Rubricoccaceae bacterium]|nr:NAD-dependent epimerase/dehydratase family protein [Rubricoccaceae bacterium]
MQTTLVTGALGQIGSDLVRALREREGAEAVLATDIQPEDEVDTAGPYEVLDVRDAARLNDLVGRYDVGTVYHLASLLSATGERKPDVAWDVNVNGVRHVLEAAKAHGLRVFWPSSIAVFGPSTPRHAPQQTVLEPTTVYGVTKVTGELLCSYYHAKAGVDVRSLRYPGIISYDTPPGGGTTDYAVEIFYRALEEGRYTCFLTPETRLPMMYMPDALQATLDLMEAPPENLTVRTSYNVAAFSFSAEEIAAALAKRVPGFTVEYAPDFRQQIADSWPASVDDAPARRDWGWAPAYDLDGMVDDMLAHLRAKLNVPAA